MPAVRVVSEIGFRLDLETDLVESPEILEDDFEVDVKITGQFVRFEDLERAIVGPRLR